MIGSPDIPAEAKLRLAILYALRYQKSERNSIPAVIDLLRQHNVPDPDVRFDFFFLSRDLDSKS